MHSPIAPAPAAALSGDAPSVEPLDRTIVVSEEEHRSGTLAPEKVRLGTLLLHARGYVLLENAVPLELVDQMRARFATILEDCRTTDREGRFHRELTPSRETRARFWE